MKEREKGTLLFLDELNEWEREKRDVGEEGERYKYPQPQRSLKSRQCRGSSAAVPLSRCGTAALGKTAMVRVKCWLSWLSN